MSAVDKVRSVLEQEKLSAAALSTRRNFSWLTQGGVSGVDSQVEAGVCTLVVSADHVILVAPVVEMDRLVREYVGDLEVEQVSYDWFDDAEAIVSRVLERASGGTKSFGADDGRADATNIAGALARARSVLDARESDLFRSFASEASACLERVLLRCEPGYTERQVETLVHTELRESGIRPAVLQVGSDDRLAKYAHALATDKAVQRHLRVAICAEQYGLVASTTRAIHFGDAPPDLRNEYQATGHVISQATAATTPGQKYSEVWQTFIDAYEQCGYPSLWRTQHQGGPTGYAPREWLIYPDSVDEVLLGQAFAWNPILRAGKAETTFLVTEAGPEIITLTGYWPTVDVQTSAGVLSAPDILQVG